MDTQPTLQTLPLDCLIEIVSNLSLPECLELRTYSRHLKAAVDEHLRFVDTLPVVLSAPSSYAEGLELEAYLWDCQLRQVKIYPGGFRIGHVTFGPPALPRRCLTIFDDERILNQARHFRRKNFIILRHTMTNIDGFIEFITKYMPRVSKLALLIDYARGDMDMNIAERIAGVYLKQLKVLLVDQTARSGWRRPRTTELWTCPLQMPQTFCTFIEEELEILEKLYFFSKPSTRMMPRGVANGFTKMFMVNMLRKLKIFHVFCCPNTDVSETMVLEILEEMLCDWRWYGIAIPDIDQLQFPALNKLICDFGTFRDLAYLADRVPNLKSLHYIEKFRVDDFHMAKLNRFADLERLNCYGFESYQTYYFRWYNRWMSVEELGEIPVNQTIKHLFIENLLSDGLPVETILTEAKLSLPYFAALETVAIREPYLKLTVDELQAHQ